MLYEVITVGLLQFEQRRHQRLGDIAAAELAEMPFIVGVFVHRVLRVKARSYNFV